jgi:hypothetical protein
MRTRPKEEMARATSAGVGLGDSDVHETNVNRLAAIAAMQMPEVHRGALTKSANEANYDSKLCALGRDFVAAKAGNSQNAAREARLKLVSLLQTKADIRSDYWADVICDAAVKEALFNVCAPCSGKGEIPDHDQPELEGRQPMKSCPTCVGSRKRRYTREERFTMLGMKPDHPDARRYMEAIGTAKGILADAERMAVATYEKLLGRD